MIDIGGYGRDNDASIFHESELGQAFEKHQSKLNVPEAELVAGFLLPYVLEGDDIFALKAWLMKPYPGKRLFECQRIYIQTVTEPEESLRIHLLSCLPGGEYSAGQFEQGLKQLKKL